MRLCALLCSLIFVAACSAPIRDLDDPARPMGDFKLGKNIVLVVQDVTQGPFSRDVSDSEWKTGVQAAFDERFTRFDGGKEYHIGVNVMGYVVATAGIPIIASPKSALIFEIVVVDGETHAVITKKPEQFTVLETFSGSSLLGSGLTSTKEEQIADLAAAAARKTENWLRKQPWFYEGRVAANSK